jgi:resuscitation-promoting factor RpfA
MNRSPEPLSPEERALAERLVRLDAHREPTTAVDAAILAAARTAVGGKAVATVAAATQPLAEPASIEVKATEAGITGSTEAKVVPLQPSPRPGRKPMARLPLGLSLAASLVLAAGIGWRLADGGGSESAGQAVAVSMKADEETAVYADAAAAAEEPTQAVMLDPDMNRIPPPPPPPPLEPQPSMRREVAMAPPDATPQAAMAKAAAPVHDGFAMDEAVAHEAEADTTAPVAGASATSAFPADADARGNAAAKSAATGGSSEGLMGRSRHASESAKDDRADGRDKVEVVGSRVARQAAPAAPPPPAVSAPVPVPAAAADQPFDDQPPVSADSPQFRQAWLQRIRKQFAEGQAEAGRKSLQEFRRRYPDMELPEDLKKIAATLLPPTP